MIFWLNNTSHVVKNGIFWHFAPQAIYYWAKKSKFKKFPHNDCRPCLCEASYQKLALYLLHSPNAAMRYVFSFKVRGPIFGKKCQFFTTSNVFSAKKNQNYKNFRIHLRVHPSHNLYTKNRYPSCNTAPKNWLKW